MIRLWQYLRVRSRHQSSSHSIIERTWVKRHAKGTARCKLMIGYIPATLRRILRTEYYVPSWVKSPARKNKGINFGRRGTNRLGWPWLAPHCRRTRWIIHKATVLLRMSVQTFPERLGESYSFLGSNWSLGVVCTIPSWWYSMTETVASYLITQGHLLIPFHALKFGHYNDTPPCRCPTDPQGSPTSDGSTFPTR